MLKKKNQEQQQKKPQNQTKQQNQLKTIKKTEIGHLELHYIFIWQYMKIGKQ